MIGGKSRQMALMHLPVGVLNVGGELRGIEKWRTKAIARKFAPDCFKPRGMGGQVDRRRLEFLLRRGHKLG